MGQNGTKRGGWSLKLPYSYFCAHICSSSDQPLQSATRQYPALRHNPRKYRQVLCRGAGCFLLSAFEFRGLKIHYRALTRLCYSVVKDPAVGNPPGRGIGKAWRYGFTKEVPQ